MNLTMCRQNTVKSAVAVLLAVLFLCYCYLYDSNYSSHTYIFSKLYSTAFFRPAVEYRKSPMHTDYHGQANTATYVPRSITDYHLKRSRISKDYEPWWREVFCNKGGHRDGKPKTPLKRLLRDITPELDNNIFLLETSCNSMPPYRAWCSLESWARQNPNRHVWYLLTSGGLAEADLPHVLLQQYKNLRVVDINSDDLFHDTPLLQLFNSRMWAQNNTWPVENLSDMLRVLVLWRWGGVYSDSDGVCIRPFTLPLNGLGFQSPELLANGLLSFQAHHPLLLEVMKDMQQKFRLNAWGVIGPASVTRAIKKTCVNFSELAKKAPAKCPGNITLYPPSHFYPIHYGAWMRLFEPGGGKHFDKTFKESFAIHFWNKFSKNEKIKINSSSIYEVAAKNFCPVTFKIASKDAESF